MELRNIYQVGAMDETKMHIKMGRFETFVANRHKLHTNSLNF
jgi:hypothetical protein